MRKLNKQQSNTNLTSVIRKLKGLSKFASLNVSTLVVEVPAKAKLYPAQHQRLNNSMHKEKLQCVGGDGKTTLGSAKSQVKSVQLMSHLRLKS